MYMYTSQFRIGETLENPVGELWQVIGVQFEEGHGDIRKDYVLTNGNARMIVPENYLIDKWCFSARE